MIRDMPAGQTQARRYSTAWRQQQAAHTRTSILNAVVQVLAGGLADLSVPAIAREAGLSVRTVYRHFPTKRDLLIALSDHMSEQAGYKMQPPPRSPGDLAQTVRDAYRQADSLAAEIQAVYATGIGHEMRRERDVPFKLRVFADALAPVLERLPPDQQQHLLHLVTILISRYTLQRFKDDLDVSADEAAETVVWALETLIDALTSRAPVNGRARAGEFERRATPRKGRRT
jgi:AcrR family transcriptional regulator